MAPLMFRPSLATDPGNTLNTAFDITLGTGASRYSDSISDTDQNDYYRFTVSASADSVTVLLSGLDANADIELYGSDGSFLPSEFNDESIGHQTGKTVDTLSRILSPGTYYIRVLQANPGETTDYTLSFLATTSTTDPLDRTLEIVNFFRAETGAAALTANAALRTAAQNHSQDMAVNDYFSHTGLNGSSVTDRAQAQGYQGTAGENISAGSATTESTLERWMSSEGHRGNILSADYQDFGVGYYNLTNDTGTNNYNHYWTQVFGTRTNNSTGETSATDVTALVVPDPGSSLQTAYDLGTLTGTQTVSDAVGASDLNDYYRFTVTTTGTFNLQLTGLTADADVQLLNSNGGQLGLSQAGNNTSESITQANLPPGTYYVRVYRYAGDTNYDLNISLQTPTTAPGLFSPQPYAGDGINSEERRLYDLIMQYRATYGLPSIPLSRALSIVANRHVVDLQTNVGYLTHAWSNAPYNGADPSTWPNMWQAPQRLQTGYPGNGYENAHGGTGGYIATAQSAFDGWRNSGPHNAVMLNQGSWSRPWNAIGIGMYQGYAVLWFGNEVDPTGQPATEP